MRQFRRVMKKSFVIVAILATSLVCQGCFLADIITATGNAIAGCITAVTDGIANILGRTTPKSADAAGTSGAGDVLDTPFTMPSTKDMRGSNSWLAQYMN